MWLLRKRLGRKCFVWSDNVFIYETKCLSEPPEDLWLHFGVCVHLCCFPWSQHPHPSGVQLGYGVINNFYKLALSMTRSGSNPKALKKKKFFSESWIHQHPASSSRVQVSTLTSWKLFMTNTIKPLYPFRHWAFEMQLFFFQSVLWQHSTMSGYFDNFNNQFRVGASLPFCPISLCLCHLLLQISDHASFRIAEPRKFKSTLENTFLVTSEKPNHFPRFITSHGLWHFLQKVYHTVQKKSLSWHSWVATGRHSFTHLFILWAPTTAT